ncbi:hypothetical protein ACN4EG_25205 [Alkalinema pantanalense CENA528]|uniref:hypothetical protein n=1 Tax=Alkalinema pantanalense TaxID=1620705 RepID=UPI003D6DB5AC
MPYKTRATKRRPEPTKRNPGTEATGTTPEQESPRRKRQENFWDKLDANHDGTIDLDDLLCWVRSVWQWFISHRFGMLVYLGLTIIAGGINVWAWRAPLAGLGPLTLVGAFLVWGCFQYTELAPKLDDLNLKASLESLIRRQRKPLEVPIINEALYSDALRYQKRYRDREKKADLWAEIRRWIAYIAEGCILIAGGELLTAMGVSWGGVAMAIMGMVGVEWGVSGFCDSAEKVLDKEERDYMQSILKQHSRQTVTASTPENN